MDGAARLCFRRDADGVTRLADLYQRAPCRILFPEVERGEPSQAVLLTTSGGLTGGDRLRLDLQVGDGAAATISTQAAEKLYRAVPEEDDTRIDVRLSVGAQAWAEYLAQETILFNRARLRRSFTAELAPDARLLAVESVVFGRTAMGEDCSQGLLHDAWRIRRGGRLIWADAMHLQGALRALRDLPFGFDGAASCATLIYTGPDAAEHREGLRELAAGLQLPAAVSLIGELLLLRLLAADAQALRAALMQAVAQLRAQAAGLAAQLPRVWYC